MSPRFFLALLLAAPVVCAAASCTEVDGWNAGRRGAAADAACTADAYAEAFRLGESLAALKTRREALDVQAARLPDQAGALRRQQRQIDVDIEAIHGVATLRGWPVQTLSRESGRKDTP